MTHCKKQCKKLLLHDLTKMFKLSIENDVKIISTYNIFVCLSKICIRKQKDHRSGFPNLEIRLMMLFSQAGVL